VKIQRWTDTGEWTTRRYLSLLGNILIWVIVAIDAFYLWPIQLHGSTSMVIVSGHSMEPTYFTGDLVIARKMAPSVGDVIVYAPDGFGGSQIVHRIVGGNAVDGWVMKGDNNPNADPFTPKASEVRGVVLVHYANFGRVTVLLLSPIVWALVLLAAVVLLVWWSGDTCEDDPEDKDKDKRADGGDPESEAEEEPDLIDRMVEGTEAAVSRMVSSAADAGTAALAALTRPSLAPRHAARTPRHAAPVLLRGSAVVAVLGLLAMYGPSTASASSLAINTGGNIFTHTYTPCTTAALTAGMAAQQGQSNNYFAVLIGNIDPACHGLSITVDLYKTDGTHLATGSGAVTGTGTSTTVPTVSTYHPQQVGKVIVKINGWPLVATWSTVLGADCSQVFDAGTSSNCVIDAVLVATYNWVDGGVTRSYQVFSITVPNTDPSGAQRTSWSATLDLTLLPHLAVPVHDFGGYNGGTVANCGNMPVVLYQSAPYQFNGLQLYVGDLPSNVPQFCSQ
jgi:signal peptidase I